MTYKKGKYHAAAGYLRFCASPMKSDEERRKRFSIFNSQLFIFLRGAVPILLVVLALLAGPALLLWWLRGGSLGLDDLLIGGAISVALLIVAGLVFGWAVGRIGRTRRK
jgi:uncharacterized BrkB/YihY/UPF0761 family membrane protein